jgi:LDH2 family malate/lactate/ureidoglycolate dehydrogenase
MSRVKISMAVSARERLLAISEERGVTPSQVTREILEAAPIREPEAREDTYVLIPGRTMDRYREASKRSGVSISALMRSTMERVLGEGPL